MSERLAYLAGIVDGEGYIGIKKTKAGSKTSVLWGKVTPSYQARIQVRMVEPVAVEMLAESFGGSVRNEKASAHGGRPLRAWSISNKMAETALRAMRPWMRVKSKSVDAVLLFRAHKATSRQHRTKVVGERPFLNAVGTVRTIDVKCLSDEYVAECERLYLLCKAINKGTA
jgi:hypothetical protein